MGKTYLEILEGRTIHTKFCDECKAFYVMFLGEKKTYCPKCDTILKNSLIKIEKVEE